MKTILISIFILILLQSCINDTDPNYEPFDLYSSFSLLDEFKGSNLEKIQASGLLDSADILLVSYIWRKKYYNNETPETTNYSIVEAYFRVPSKVDIIKCNQKDLFLTNPLMPSVRFRSTNDWLFENPEFGSALYWEFIDEDGFIYTDTSFFAQSLFDAHLSTRDSLSVSKSFNLTWTPTEEEDFLMLDFTWKPTKYDTSFTRKYNGFVLEDDGFYSFSANQLTELGIESNGVLEFHLLRVELKSMSSLKYPVIKHLSFTNARISVYLGS